MAWTYVATEDGASYGAANTVSAGGTLHVEVGDVLIAALGFRCATSTNDGMDIGAGVDNFTMLAEYKDDQDDYLAIGYVVVGTHNASGTVRATFSTAAGLVAFEVLQFRPDAGDIVSLVAGPSPAVGLTGTNPTSDVISPSGGDLLVWGGLYTRNERTLSNHQIAESAADGYTNNPVQMQGAIWYKLYTSAQNSIAAECTLSGSDKWVCDVAALESAAAAGGGKPMYAYAQQ